MTKCIFREIEIEVEPAGKTMDLDFNGHYLIQVDESFVPTGFGIDGYGAPLQFEKAELDIEEEI